MELAREFAAKRLERPESVVPAVARQSASTMVECGVRSYGPELDLEVTLRRYLMGHVRGKRNDDDGDDDDDDEGLVQTVGVQLTWT